jgi:N-dimethylarginine dimethylaminohydrolase
MTASMKKINPKIYSETGRLKTVILGIPDDIGPVPILENCYDPKSKESVKNGLYPTEKELKTEMNAFSEVLERHGVTVIRPEVLAACNQVFARDVCFTIEEKFIIPHIIKERQYELDGLKDFIDQIDSDALYRFEDGLYAEGGDCMPWKDHLFIGCSSPEDFESYKTARTNEAAVARLRELFPERKVYPIELKKNDEDPRQGILHLDCCFQPIGRHQAIIYPGGFKLQKDVDYITKLFGAKNLIIVNQDEFYQMFPNVFSIDEKTIVSNKDFARLNDELRRRGFTVEEIPYTQVSLMGGLLRCSTMPIEREK